MPTEADLRYFLFTSSQLPLATREYISLVRPLRDVDEEMHFAYFRMLAGRYDDLIRVESHIKHQGTHSMPVDGWFGGQWFQ